jgi:phospholipid transport system substrate-binding protein
MFRLERIIFAVFFSLAVVFASSSVRAESATDFVKGCQNEVISILRDQKAGARRDENIGAVLAKMLDFDHLARQSLASHWDELDKGQHKEFTDTLRALVQRSYERNIKDVLDFNVEYLREEKGEDGQVTVYTRATPKAKTGDEPVEIDYRMDQPDGKWRVVDIVTEDSSLVANYKSQFHRTIKKDGYDALIRKMKNKLAKGKKS